MKPAMPTSRKTIPTSRAPFWTGVRSMVPTSLGTWLGSVPRSMRGSCRTRRVCGSTARRARVAVREPRPHAGAAPGLALQLQLAAEGRHTVREAPQAGAGLRVGAADAVVGDLDRRPARVGVDADGHARRLAVLARVCERLRDEVVGGRLDGR